MTSRLETSAIVFILAEDDDPLVNNVKETIAKSATYMQVMHL